MVSQDGDVGAVHRAAHVQAAGQRHPQVGRKPHALEVVEQHVHGGLDRAGGVGGRGVAVYPALGVDDVGDARTGAADRELEAAALELAAFEVLDERFDLLLVVDHELDVVARGPADVSAAVLVGDLADLADEQRAHQAGAAGAHGEDLVAGLGHMVIDARFEILMIQPRAFVLGNNGRIEFVVFARADVGDTVFHRLLGIVSGRNKCHSSSPLSQMMFAEFVDVARPAALDLIFLPEDVGVGPRLLHMAGIGRNPGRLQ